MVKYPSTPWPRGQSVVSSTQDGISSGLRVHQSTKKKTLYPDRLPLLYVLMRQTGGGQTETEIWRQSHSTALERSDL
uniref:Uncharacterized protein n=1 Tax=Anguilla anguilla TaxID=7936 RepID=A0A0E9U0T0_ANGAN